MKKNKASLCILIVSVMVICAATLHAEVVLDGSMGTSGAVDGPQYDISSDLGQIAGSNLFHSFSEFSINEAEVATFSGPNSVQNIIGRVTGGNASNIDGVIRSTITGADLYLLNPAGILFGPKARINLRGSFHASTADYLGFEDAMKFYSQPVQGELLSSAPPSSFGFLGDSFGSIVYKGPGDFQGGQAPENYAGLEVSPEATIALVAGEILLTDGAVSSESGGGNTGGPPNGGDGPPNGGDGPPNGGEGPPNGGDGPPNGGDGPPNGGDGPPTGGEDPPNDQENPGGQDGKYTRLGSLTAPGGDIHLVAVNSAGEVVMTENGPDTSSFSAMGDIRIENDSLISTSGNFSGNIYIRGGKFYLSNSAIENFANSTKSAGLVDIAVQSADIVEGGTVDVSTKDSGDGGTILLHVEDHLLLAGANSEGALSSLNVNSMLEAPVAGDAGEIRINAGAVTIKDGAFITGYTTGGGKGGSVYLNADGEVLIAGVYAPEEGDTSRSGILVNTLAEGDLGGDAGNLELTAQSLVLADGGNLESQTYGMGDGGRIEITADSVLLHTGEEGDAGGYIGIGNDSSSNGGDGGTLIIEAKNLTLGDGSNIAASAEGPGEGGDIELYIEDTLHLSGVDAKGFAASIQATSRSVVIEGQETGPPGTIDPVAGPDSGLQKAIEPEEPTLPPPAYSHGGPGGSIHVEAGRIILEDGGHIIANSDAILEGGSASDAGTIHIKAGEIVARGVNPHGETLDGFGSGIYSKSFGIEDLAGDAGTILVEAGSLTLEDGGVIVSNTNAWPSGGGITIDVKGDINISGNGLDLVTEEPLIQQELFLSMFGPEDRSSGISGIYASSTDTYVKSGDSGEISVSAANLNLSNGGQIDATSNGGGAAGAIDITLEDTLRMESGAKISTSAMRSGGGQIDLQVKNRILLDNSRIETNVAKGQESGGDITIDPQFVILNKSTISANADAGKGGNISIVADHFIASADSAVTASSKTGIDGNVVINSPDVNLKSTLANLPVKYLDATQWAQTPCDQRSAENISRFEIMPSETVYAPLDDFRAAIPIPDDKTIADYVNREDYAGLLATLDQEEDSLRKTVWQALAFQSLGRVEEAEEVLDKARELFDLSDDLKLKAQYLSQKGDLALLWEDIKAAISNTKQGLKTAQEGEDLEVTACLWNNLGNLRSVNKDYFGATKAYNQSLEILKESIEGQQLVPLVRTNLARQYLKAGRTDDFNRAIAASIQAMPRLEPTIEKARAWIALFLLAGNTPDWDFGTYQQFQAGLEEAVHIAEEAGSYRTLSHARGCQGLLLTKAGENDRALEVAGQAMHYAQLSHSPDLLFQWLRLWGFLAEKQGQSSQAVLAYKQAVATLGPIRMDYLNSFRDKTDVFDTNIRPVYLEMAALFLNNQELLDQAQDTMELLKRAEIQNYFQDECFTARPWSELTAESMPPGAAVLYPMSFPEGLSLLLITQESMESFHVPVKKAHLEARARSFRSSLEQGNEHILEDAQHLYNWIIEPIQEELSARGVDTLVVAPDGMLRLIPFGALHDGERFLVETIAVSTVSAASLTDLESDDLHNKRALLNGLTVEKDGFAPLPHVAKELQAINSMVPGKVLIDEEFTLPNLQSEFNGQDYNIVHMASHAVFGGRPENSFLLTYSGKLYVNELEQLVGATKYRGQVLDLLMLSACETAMGDERAAFGIAGVALSAGAKSTVATLWEADDEAAAMLVEEFYKKLVNSRASKAKALQAAQLKLLENDKFHHPSYWASFTLIGNWR